MSFRHDISRRLPARAGLVLSAALASSLLGSRARALDPPEPAEEEAPAEIAAQMSSQGGFDPGAEPAWMAMWNRPGPSGLASVMGELSILPEGQLGSDRQFAGGVQFQVLGAGRRWPLMVGLGGGNLWLAHASERGQRFTLDGDDDWYVSTTIERSLEVRHVELMARFQPLWGVVRPYVEGFFGMSILRQSAQLEDRYGEVLAEQDPERSVGMVYGGTVGVDIGARSGFAFTLGVKRFCTSDLDRIEFSNRDDSWSLSENERAAIKMWSPFVGLTIAI